MLISEDGWPSAPIDSTFATDRAALEVAHQLDWGLAAFASTFSDDLREVLFVQLGDYAAHHYGGRPWTLPGGGVESGELPSHAVARELREECGINVPHDRFVPAAWLPRPYYVGRRARPGELVVLFAASVVRPLPVPRSNPPETVDAQWVPADLSSLFNVPDEGVGKSLLQPLPRHWLYWAMLGQAALNHPQIKPWVHVYSSATEMKLPPWSPAEDGRFGLTRRV